MQITAYLLTNLPEDGLAKRARELFALAIERNLEPKILSRANRSRRSSIYLSLSQATRLTAIAHKHGLEPHEAFAAMVAAAYASETSAPSVDLRTSSRKRLQDLLFDPLMTGIHAGKIVMAEGGTGLGKSRIIGRAALSVLNANPDARIGIFAPTLSVLHHLAEEFIAACRSAKQDVPKTAFVIGRSNFIDPSRFDEVIAAARDENNEMLPSPWTAALDWAQSGAAPVCAASLRIANETGLPIHWLSDDLAYVCPSFPVASCQLDADSDPDGAAAVCYTKMRANAANASVVFTSHTMACLNALTRLRNQTELLPHIDVALFDEAHELEDKMAQVVGSNFSILLAKRIIRSHIDNGYWSKIRAQKAATLALTACVELDAAARSLGTKDFAIKPWDADSTAKTTILQRARDLATAIKSLNATLAKQIDPPSPLRAIVSWVPILNQIAAGKDPTWVSFSPIIRTPSFTVGPLRLNAFFAALWDEFSAAGLLSGTLYLNLGDGAFSNGYMRMKLAIPVARLHTISPITPPWLLTTPTVYLPQRPIDLLCYPGLPENDSNQAPYKAWTHSVASHLASVAQSAVGGTLVLCCSFRDIEALSGILSPILNDRLICQSSGNSMAQIASSFIERGRAGLRPVWLATGSAWTGLNLSLPDIPAESDFILTDLVIPRLPFQLTQTSVHMARMTWMGFDCEMLETAFRFRQGLGRLMRKEGVRDRRIWILDARMMNRKKSGYYRRITGILNHYSKRKPLADVPAI